MKNVDVKPTAQALAATLRSQGREVLSGAEAAATGILPGA